MRRIIIAAGAIGARLWNVGEPVLRSFEAGDFLLVKGKVQLFQGALQMILNVVERQPPGCEQQCLKRLRVRPVQVVHDNRDRSACL